MTDYVEPTTIGLGDATHAILRRLKEEGPFPEMMDAYRFAIALALLREQIAVELSGTRVTVFNVGTLDPDRILYTAIKSLRGNVDEPIYRTAERLAEWGVIELGQLVKDGEIDLAGLLSSTS